MAGFFVLVAILLPFILFGDITENLAIRLVNGQSSSAFLPGLAIVSSLALDVFLPIPSSILSTTGGILYGWFVGAMLSFIGMTACCLIGYSIGRYAADISRWMSDETRSRLGQYFERTGDWTIVIARPVPVLAEASVIFAGIARMPVGKFVVYCAVSNMVISFIYATIGAFSMTVNSFLPAFGAALILPVVFRLVLPKRSRSTAT